MKILEIDYDYYYYPQDISCIDDFIEYLNAHYNTFIKLKRFQTENCTFPFFIEGEVHDVYLNVATMEKILEKEVSILSRLDYDARLEQIVKTKCVDCIHYQDDSEGDNLKGHRQKISLDGECWGYERKN